MLSSERIGPTTEQANRQLQEHKQNKLIVNSSKLH